MDKKLRFAIIGVGDRGLHCWGKMIMARKDAEVVAYCDTNRLRMEKANEYLGIKASFYSNFADMAAAETLDAVVVTPPDCFHEEYAVAALKAGMHVLVDKPLATSVKACQNVLDAAKASNKTIMIGFNLRHNAVLKKLKQIITEGVIGTPFLVENREFYNGGRTYMSRWNGHYDISSGLWIHKGCHDFDVFQWLLGFPKPVRVSSFAGINVLNPQHYPFELKDGVQPGPTCHQRPYKDVCKDVYDLGLEEAQYGQMSRWGDEAAKLDGYHKDSCMYQSDMSCHDNGFAIVEYENGARASHMECFITPSSDRKYTVVGTGGVIEASLSQRKITVKPRWSDDVITYDIAEERGGHGGADPHLLESFIKVVKGEERNTSLPEHGMMSTAVGQAAEMSRRQKRTIEISELF